MLETIRQFQVVMAKRPTVQLMKNDSNSPENVISQMKQRRLEVELKRGSSIMNMVVIGREIERGGRREITRQVIETRRNTIRLNTVETSHERDTILGLIIILTLTITAITVILVKNPQRNTATIRPLHTPITGITTITSHTHTTHATQTSLRVNHTNTDWVIHQVSIHSNMYIILCQCDSVCVRVK